MTDQYGAGSPGGHEGETPDHGHDPETSANWQDDQPPFEDAEAFASQEPESGGAEDETAHALPPRKSMLLPVVAGIGGLLFLGVMVWWQFGRAPAAPPPSPMAVALDAKPGASPSHSSAVLDMKSLYEPSHDAAPVPPPSPAHMADSGVTPSAMNVAPTTGFTPPAAAAPAASVAASTSSTSSATAVPPPAKETETAAPASLSAAPTSAPAADEARLKALAAQVDALQKQLDHVSGQLSALKGGAGAGLGDQVNRLEQQVLKLEHDQKEGTAVEEPSRPLAAAHEEEPARAPHRHMRHHETAHRRPHREARRAPRPAHRAGTAEARKETAHGWVLRAAMPGEAWVSASATSAELRHVKIGETLPGIGRVLAIRELVGGGWMVEGSNGDIR